MKAKERKYLGQQYKLQIITMVASVLAFCITNYSTARNFIEDRKSQRAQTLLEHKLDVYKEACKVVGIIIGDAEAKSPELEKHINDFEKLYWGEMALIEDAKVVKSAKQFREKCRVYVKTNQTEKDNDTLKNAAIKFTDVCKLSYTNSWNTMLNDQ